MLRGQNRKNIKCNCGDVCPELAAYHLDDLGVRNRTASPLPKAIKYASPFTLALGSIVNPVLYSLKKPDFRHVCNKMCCFILTPRISFDGNNLSTALNSKNAFTRAATITKSPSTVPLKLMEQRHDLQSKDNSTNELLTQD